MPRKPVDISNQTFGKLHVVSFRNCRTYGKGRKTLAFWECRCDCGSTVECSGNELRALRKTSCGRCSVYGGWVIPSPDLSGKVVGTYTVIKVDLAKSTRWKHSHSWLCRCQCGHEEVFRACYLTTYKPRLCPVCKHQALPASRGLLTPIKRISKEIVLWSCECGGQIEAKIKCRIKSCGCAKVSRVVKNHTDAARQVFQQYQKDAARRKKPFDLTESDFYNLITSPCHYTGMLPSKKIKTQQGTFFWNGVDRKDNSKGYILDNCLPCSQYANWAKERRPYDDFMVWLDQVAKFRTEQKALQKLFEE